MLFATKKKKEIFPFVTTHNTYNPATPNLQKKKIEKNFELLATDSYGKYKREKSIKETMAWIEDEQNLRIKPNIYAFEQKLEYSLLRSHSCQLWKRILQSVYENKPFLSNITFSMEKREKKIKKRQRAMKEINWSSRTMFNQL